MNNHFVRIFLKENKRVILLFFLFSFLIYANSIVNDFTVVDDLAGFVQNPVIRNTGESFKSFNLQTITYAISYGLFGMTSAPLRILAITNHAIVAIMLYAMMHSIFNRKVAIISGLLFIAHPVNTESLNWVSAQFYIVMAGFFYSAILSHILYRKTGNKKYLILTGAIITLEFLLIKHAWVLVVPAAIVVIDFFLVKKRFDFIFYASFAALLSPILFFYIFGNLFSSIEQRQVTRQANSGKTLTNQQLLAPVDEGYPYSVFTLTRLYTFPKDLTMYYDGNPVTKTDLNYMRVVLFLYIAAFIFFLFKDKRISGLLLLLLLLIAPVFAPQKITWYMTERYLYSGTGFFTTLLALLIVSIEKRLHWKQFTVVATILLLCLYSVRTFVRNLDWKDSETIAKATIQSSPFTVRPYNDVGGYYIMHKRYDEAKKSYVHALKVGASGTAQKNLGYIYLSTGLDPSIKTLTFPYEQIVMNGMNALQTKDYDSAMYFFNEAYAQNPTDTRVLNSLGTIYTDTGSFNNAEQLLQESLTINDKNAETYYVLGYLAFKKGNKASAIENLQQALKLNPEHNAAKTNLNILLGTQ
jgi:tetratricopeptide (TPR) repeat protein